MNRFRKLKIVLYLTALFLAGVATGIFVSFQVARHMMPSEARMAGRWTYELQTKLNLSPEQMQKIRPIVTETIGRFKVTLKDDVLSAFSDCNARIAADLTPEQKVKLEKLEKEQRGFIESKLGGESAPKPKSSGTN